jgi:hypothetical protein
MAEKTDLRKVQAALDRAAKNAVSGPKEARAGRFAADDGALPARRAPHSLARKD